MEQISEILRASELTPTENRKKVLKIFHEANRVLSQKEIETSVVDMDRITLYRTLKAFVTKGLIHKIVDGTKHPKYAICQNRGYQDNHAHFHCTACEKTMCLNQVPIPNIPNIPEGYQVNKTNLVISGVCGACN